MLPVFAWIFAIPMLGFLTGSRTMTPMCVLCWFAYAGNLGVPADVLRSAAGAGHALAARIVFGGLVGALAATGMTASAVEGALLGAIAAAVGTFVGFHVRHWLVKEKGFPDLGVALTEDVLVIVLSILAMGIVTG